jgi:hypothetical protein
MYTGPYFEFDFTDVSRNAKKEKVTVRFYKPAYGKKGLVQAYNSIPYVQHFGVSLHS